MVDLYIDPVTGDLDFYNKSIRLTNNLAELTRQRIDTTLKTYRGEWFYNILEGIPYLERDNQPIQLIGRGSKEDFDSYIKKAILEKPFVTSITSYNSQFDKLSGQLRITFSVSGSGSEGREETISIEI